MLPPNLQPEAVQTWVSSRRKFIALPGQLSAVINNLAFAAKGSGNKGSSGRGGDGRPIGKGDNKPPPGAVIRLGVYCATNPTCVALATVLSLGSDTPRISQGGGGNRDNIAAGDQQRIMNAAEKYGVHITVVGSRASGTAGAYSDWDYVVPNGTSAKILKGLKNSLPSGPRGLGEPRNLEIDVGSVNKELPYVSFSP